MKGVPEDEADNALVDLLCRRTAARAAKDFDLADRLRDEIAESFAVELNDRASTWRDSSGRVGTQDGPDFFEDRAARLQKERKERKKQKEKEKEERRAAAKAANAFSNNADAVKAEASTRDPNAFVEWLRSEAGPLKRTKPYAMYPSLAEQCIDIIEQWRKRFPKVS